MTKETAKKLIGKIIISGKIKVLTGLAIGGNKSGIDIGGMDNPVIKTYDGKPYIPGSSLKGKLRSLLAKTANTNDVAADVELIGKEGDYKYLALVFGYGANDRKDSDEKGEALLKVRDAYLKEDDESISDKAEMKTYTEEKMENNIDRITGKATPRPHERVFPGSEFKMELCLDVYDESEAKEQLELIDLAFQLLNEDYLGGGGTRGNGRVQVTPEIKEYLKIENKKLEAETNSNELLNYKFKESKNASEAT